MLVARGLSKSYQGRTAVSDLSFELRPGEIVGLLGPNGAGKTTTVAMLCGLTQPDSGEVLIVSALSPTPLPRSGRGEDSAPSTAHSAGEGKRRIGLVPQELALYEDLSARHNLSLFGALYGITGVQAQERIAQVLALVGLSDRANDKPLRFSGGMKRRPNIACALMHDPDILLLDEPTVGVDPQSRNAIFDNLETLRDRGKALLYTTHYMEEAERLCDRILIMDHGRLIAADTLAGLLARLPERVVEARPVEPPRGNLEDVFLALTGRQLRD